MDQDTLITVEGASKRFCRRLKTSLWYGLQDLGNELIGRRHGASGELRKHEFWALNDVNFELKRGECLGLLGRNGAGKTTLLRMLNGLIKPDAGRIEIRGRTNALIALGAGFNPILTGRENIYVNGAVLGLPKREIDAKLDAIIDFSELSEFIDTPVRNYSSGMAVRLGFAVAAQMNPDVLIVDEVLAVGDVGFKIKCYNEITKLMADAAVIFVSHSMSQISRICTRGALLEHGRITLDSNNVTQVIARYNNLFTDNGLSTFGSGRAELTSMRVTTREQTLDVQGLTDAEPFVLSSLDLPANSPLALDLSLRVAADVEAFFLKITLSDTDEQPVAQFICDVDYFENNADLLNISIETGNLVLNTGTYGINVAVVARDARDYGETLLSVRNVARVNTEVGRYVGVAPVLFPVAARTGTAGKVERLRR